MSPLVISPRILVLRRRVEAGDTAAIETFWHQLTREGTPLEPLEGDREHLLLTLIWRAEAPVRNVVVVPAWSASGTRGPISWSSCPARTCGTAPGA